MKRELHLLLVLAYPDSVPTIGPATAEHRSQSRASFPGRASHVLPLHRAELPGTWSGFSVVAS